MKLDTMGDHTSVRRKTATTLGVNLEAWNPQDPTLTGRRQKNNFYKDTLATRVFRRPASDVTLMLMS